MSWLSGIASKTENLLNSLDQGAATALKKPKPVSKQTYAYDAENASPMPASTKSAPASASSRTSSRQGTPTAGRRRTDQDEQLIAFLNDSTPVKPASNHSRQSSVSSVASVGNFLMMASGNGNSDTTTPTPSADTAITIPGAGSAPSGENGNHSDSDQVRMLQKEIFNLNREMAQLLQRTKLSEKEGTKLKYQLSSNGDQLAEADRQCRHLKQRETDLVESLQAKDSQLAILKVRLDEADGELRSRQSSIDRLQMENDRILQSSSDASGLQSGTIQGLQDRLQEAEGRARQLQQRMEAAQQEHERRQEQLSAEQASLTAELSVAREQLQLQQGSAADLQKQLAEQRLAADTATQQLTEYKLKAQRILQSKDQLIADLKTNGKGSGGGDLRDAELEQMRSERELAQSEVHQMAAMLQQLREELQQAEAAAQEEAEAAAGAAREAEAREASDRRLRAELEQELDQSTQEARFLREEMIGQKTQTLSRLQERDEEIERLRRQITSKHVASCTEVELETRLRSLTENLIQKQTNIESLSTQNRSLALQLERAQSQMEEMERCAPASERQLASESSDALRQRPTPALFVETPWDGSVTRRVKRAYSSLDACSVRLGVFLKRYPIARIFVIGYMCLLHLWVMIVLFTYTPEVHGDSYRNPHSEDPLP